MSNTLLSTVVCFSIFINERPVQNFALKKKQYLTTLKSYRATPSPKFDFCGRVGNARLSKTIKEVKKQHSYRATPNLKLDFGRRVGNARLSKTIEEGEKGAIYYLC